MTMTDSGFRKAAGVEAAVGSSPAAQGNGAGPTQLRSVNPCERADINKLD